MNAPYPRRSTGADGPPKRQSSSSQAPAPDGVLVQTRGSRSPWLEGREPKRRLLIAVSDVTGTVAQAAFHTTEDTREYLMLLEALVRRRCSSRATTPPFSSPIHR